jgi:ribonuclease HI/DNA polymerase-3 subunit epsilon
MNIYTDGACKGNPGRGGWGVFIVHPNGSSESFCGGAEHTTNNRMELCAAIEGLRRCPNDNECVLYTDSVYVKKGITEWITNWKARGWKTSSNKPVLNQDLWHQLDTLNHSGISWQWIKGHAGHFGNTQADLLANRGC